MGRREGDEQEEHEARHWTSVVTWVSFSGATVISVMEVSRTGKSKSWCSILWVHLDGMARACLFVVDGQLYVKEIIMVDSQVEEHEQRQRGRSDRMYMQCTTSIAKKGTHRQTLIPE